ncbi:MAG: alanine dehydrogenase [Candidatus Omnitrophica bacterium]|nr:alanine dehydrogenase [Candidatus Omnitrophota bacterium]
MKKSGKDAKVLILKRSDVERLVDMKSAIKAVENVFREYGLNKIAMPPKIYLELDKYSGDFRAMPAYVEKLNKCAVKWVNVHPKNNKAGLPSVMAVIVLSDPRNGLPLCIMDGTYITNMRTGAAGGVAAKYLARKNSRSVAMVGCGVQAQMQLAALKELFKITEVRFWGLADRSVRDFILKMKKTGLRFKRCKSVKECVFSADIIVTTTPSRKPIVKIEWLKKGVHINAIGADARGKQELDPKILKNAKVVVDSWEQASHSGEINVPCEKGSITKKDIYADIGEIVSGRKRGRVKESEIIVFDSTGLAIQDVAVADLVYKKAAAKKIGSWIKLL